VKITSRLIMIIGSLLLVGVYFVPIWSISLDAPQYPEGIGLKIHVNTIVGEKEYDLQNINNLNHYIGMKRIEPDSITELQYMPIIIGIMCGLGVLLGIIGKRNLVLGWAILFMIIGAIGLTDFYMWEYDYGHNLDPHAAIQIDGMSYQPPLLGTKQLLNFTAHSFPDVGGYLVGGSIVCAFLAWFLGRTVQPKVKSVSATILIFSVSSLFASCANGPDEIIYGKEDCAHCKMTIADNKFAAQLVTHKRKVYKFDAIECMAGYIIEGKVPKEDIGGMWVNVFNKPGGFSVAEKSHYVQSDNIASPMGLFLSAYTTKEEAEKMIADKGGKLLYWDGVKLLVAKEWE